MSSDIVPFDFNGHELRTVTGEDGSAWFVHADACTYLEIKNSRDALSRLRNKGVGSTDTLTAGGVQQMTIIDEANLYRLVSRSDKPEATAFMDWLVEEVIPQIRKTGAYLPRALTPGEILAVQAQAIISLEKETAIARSEAILANHRLDAIEGRHNWFSALGFAKTMDLPTSTTYLARLGRTAVKIARSHDIEPEKVQHAHYGSVNQLPDWVWREAMDTRQSIH